MVFLLSVRVAAVLEWSWEVASDHSLALACWIAPLHILLETLVLIPCSLLYLQDSLTGPLIMGAGFFLVHMVLFLWLYPLLMTVVLGSLPKSMGSLDLFLRRAEPANDW